MRDGVTDSLGDGDRVVSFYLPERQALEGADPLTLDADRDWAVFGTGVYVWILQTFLRLRRAGAPVQLVDSPPRGGILVAHAAHFDRILAEAPAPADLILVVAQSDRAPQPLADFTIVQNASSADRYAYFIPSWLQPGLVPRASDRGTRVENVVYAGSIKELDPDLGSPAWAEALRTRGLTWDTRTITFSGNDQFYRELRWNDYATTDVVVALRVRASRDARPKPAAKLQNAWAAGVPAILSPEAPYREVRRSPLDYLEASSGPEALAAIDRLRSDPGLYAEMVRNGRERAREFHPDRLVERWRDVLWREIPRRTQSRVYRLFARDRRTRAVLRRIGDRARRTFTATR